MNMIEITKLLGKALRENLCFIEVSPAGRGAYGFTYDPTYELTLDGYRITLSDVWCGESQHSGFCYRRFLSVNDEFSCRVARLNGVAQKLLAKIPIGQDEDIAKAAGVEESARGGVEPRGKPNMIQAAQKIIKACDDCLPIVAAEESTDLDVLYYKDKLSHIFAAAEQLREAVREWDTACAKIAQAVIHEKIQELEGEIPK